MNPAETRDDAVADIPLQCPACFPNREDGGAHVRRGQLEFSEDILRHFLAKFHAPARATAKRSRE